jgi:SOS-response transcriptional repressor LexA
MSDAGMGLTRMMRAALLVVQEMSDAAGGVPPTYREIAAELELESKSGVVRLVTALVERGYLVRLRGRARSLSIRQRIPVPEEDEVVGLFDAPGLSGVLAGVERAMGNPHG